MGNFGRSNYFGHLLLRVAFEPIRARTLEFLDEHSNQYDKILLGIFRGYDNSYNDDIS